MNIKEKISNLTPKGTSKKAAILLSSLGLIAGVAGTVAMQTHAAGTTNTATQTTSQGQHNRGNFTPPAAVGSVTAISGNTITLTDKKSSTTYTVDASNATINKFTQGTNGAKGTQSTITVSQIAVGDNIMVQGTVSGTSITATKIEDGMMGGRGGFGGHGQPGTVGTVASISGNTATLTGKDGTTYTVDLSGANIQKTTTITAAGISVGDTLMVNGTVSGTSVTAKNVIDGQLPTPPANAQAQQ